MNQPDPQPNPHGGDATAVARSLGLEHVPRVALDFSVNINPLGPPAGVEAILHDSVHRVSSYPEAHAESATAKLAHNLGIAPEQILLGNGSTEILGWIVAAFRPKSPAWPTPCYAGYSEACEAAGIRGTAVTGTGPTGGFAPDFEALVGSAADMFFLGNPNNPTGGLVPRDAVLRLAAAKPEALVVVDESFMDFVGDGARYSLAAKDIPRNVVVVKSLTKFFAIPGLRLGMAYGREETIGKIRAAALPWSVNALAQSVAGHLYSDSGYMEQTRRVVAEQRQILGDALRRLPGFKVYPSAANFILVELPGGMSVAKLQAELLKRGVLVRSCANFAGLGERYCRLAVRPANENNLLIETLRAAVNPPRPAGRDTPPVGGTGVDSRARALMVVGTMSNSGKSIVAAGLCRYFARLGHSVAPFKAQNMSLNSFVTVGGGEMGRAQVVQAHAAGVEPHTDMNPVLLKPLGEAGCQVIVDGRPAGNFTAGSYYSEKKQFREAAEAAFDRLAGNYDTIIMEGAGSPAEINLRDDDFVNLSMAEYAGAPAILVADIDRGGVFASILGTLALLPGNQRRLVRGVIINKFRGDVRLLEPGIREIESITGVPVLGVLPMVRDLGIDDEDSLSLDERPAMAKGTPLVDIVVVRVPRISNFTDFQALEATPGVRVRYETEPAKLGSPDLVVLPGTRNTCGDLAFLHEKGWTRALRGIAGRIPILGICGGYQMLGRRVMDPNGVEGFAKEQAALDLLPLETTLEETKILDRVEGTFLPGMLAGEGVKFRGYEIHAGRTKALSAVAPLLQVSSRNGQPVDQPDGATDPGHLVSGCYVHGIFDLPSTRVALLTWLCRRKGESRIPSVPDTDPMTAFDRLADLLAQHVDMDRVRNMVFGVCMAQEG